MSFAFAVPRPDGRSVATYQLPVTLYHLRLPSRPRLSSSLARDERTTTAAAAGNIGDTMRRLYERHGALVRTATRRDEPMLSPCLALPQLAHQQAYNVLAIELSWFARTIAQHDARFDATQSLIEMCESEAMDLQQCFPSLRHETRHDHPPLGDYWYDRLVPIALLPLWLARLPEWYHACNGIVRNCRHLEGRLLAARDLACYPHYVMEQVHAMATNVNYVSFQSQQRLVSARGTLQQELYETELAAVRRQLAESRRRYENLLLKLSSR